MDLRKVGGCVPVGLSLKYSCCYSLHFLMWSSLSSTTVALPLSAGRLMMFSFYWRDFKNVGCFLGICLCLSIQLYSYCFLSLSCLES